MRLLNEAKSINDEYEGNWNEIERSVFDEIISLDPNTNIENNRLGPSAKQLLLPRYIDGETDFLSYKDDVKKALIEYTQNRGKYPQVLRNITAFPSVKDFVEYILKGEESDFAKRIDLTIEKEPEKKSKLDQIYDKYYSNIDRENFDKIINLDSETTENSIGTVAKNLLLPKFQSGEDFLDKDADIEKAINFYYSEKDSYPQDKKAVQNFVSVSEFVDFVLTGPESQLWKALQQNETVDSQTRRKVKDDVVLEGATRDYEIIQPLSHAANNAITCLNERKPRNNEYLNWCTGWTNDISQWNNHSRNEYIYCFMYKKNPKDRLKNYQLAITKSDYTVSQFLDGNDEAFGKFNANQAVSTAFFETFLFSNPDVARLLSTIAPLSYCPTVKKVNKTLSIFDKPFVYKDDDSFVELLNNVEKVKNNIKEVIIESTEIPSKLFFEFSNLRSVTFKEGLKKIGAEAFMKCISLNNVQFPESLEEIGAEAFANCIALKNTIKIPNNLTKIGINAFRDTKCTLSIDKKRTKKLNVNPADKDWFIHHVKAITVQEGLEEDLVEAMLDENIPLDLARAYERSTPAERGIQSHPESEHWKIGSRAPRKGVAYDYARSNYEAISKEEAADIIKHHRDQIPNLRFIIDGNLIEYEIRSGDRLYQTYYMTIPQEILDANDVVILDKNGNPTNDSRYALRYGDLLNIIKMSDKIYKTDEYEHLITPETKTGKKIKIVKTDAEGNPIQEPVVDDDGNPVLDRDGNPVLQYVYEIVDDTIENRRKRQPRGLEIKTMVPKSHSSFRPHRPYSNFGSFREFKKYMLDKTDTGAHNVDYFEGVPSDIRKILKNKKEAFKRYDYVRKALKKLESERDLYDEDEYQSLHDDFTRIKDQEYAAYLELITEYKKLKDKYIVTFDEIIKQYNYRLEKQLSLLEAITSQLFQLDNELSDLLLKDVSNYELTNLNEKIKDLLAELEDYRNKKQKLLNEIDSLKRQIENNDIDIETAILKIVKCKDDLSELTEKSIEQKFKRVAELQARKDKLVQDLNRLSPKQAELKARRAAKNKEKEMSQELQDIVVFGDEEETTETNSSDSEE